MEAPIFPNFPKISRILEGSYLFKFQNEEGQILDLKLEMLKYIIFKYF